MASSFRFAQFLNNLSNNQFLNRSAVSKAAANMMPVFYLILAVFPAQMNHLVTAFVKEIN